MVVSDGLSDPWNHAGVAPAIPIAVAAMIATRHSQPDT